MEITPSNFITTLILFLSFIFLLIKFSRRKSRSSNEKLPPSPPRLPIIGHLHHLMGGLPHHTLARVSQKYGPVLHLQLGELSLVVISSTEAAKSVLKDQEPACADRPESIGFKIVWYNNADFAFAPYSKNWRQFRTICITEMLSAKNVRSYGSIRQDEAGHLIKSVNLLCKNPVDLTQKLKVLSSSIVCRIVFGKVVQDREMLTTLIRKGLSMAGGFELADLFPSSKVLNALCWNKHKLWHVHCKLDRILDVILEEHRLNPAGEFGGEDIVDVLLRMQQSGQLEFPITHDNIKGVILDIFAGGTDTFSTTVEFAMIELMKNPTVMAKVQEEVRCVVKGMETVEESEIHRLKYLKLVIKETLRLHPPATLLPRACRDECMVDGYSIPLNSRVLVNVWGIGRDPKYWNQPETFQPERFENSSIDFGGSCFEYLPFGAGKRMCPGMNFGLANIELTLAQLLYHFDWNMPEGMTPDDIDMTEEFGLSVARKNPLYLVPTTYNHLVK